MASKASPVRILIGFKLVEALRDVLDGVSGYVKLNQLNWQLLQCVPVSRRWLDQRFKQLVGHTASQELRRRRADRVRELLLHMDLSIKQIAQRCAFSSTENMSRFFRDAYGMPPQPYRVRHAVPRVRSPT